MQKSRTGEDGVGVGEEFWDVFKGFEDFFWESFVFYTYDDDIVWLAFEDVDEGGLFGFWAGRKKLVDAEEAAGVEERDGVGFAEDVVDRVFAGIDMVDT